MSADGMLVRSPLEAARLEIQEMSAYCTRLESELCQANVRRQMAESRVTTLNELLGAVLRGFQRQDAVTNEVVVEYFSGDPSLESGARKLLAKLQSARMEGARKSPAPVAIAAE